MFPSILKTLTQTQQNYANNLIRRFYPNQPKINPNSPANPANRPPKINPNSPQNPDNRRSNNTPQSQETPANNGFYPTGGGGGRSSGGGGGGGDGGSVAASNPIVDNSNPILAALYEQQYNTLGNYLSGLPNQQNAQEQIVNKQLDASRASLQNSYNRNVEDLNLQDSRISQNKIRSLNDLTTKGRNMMQALNNQFGAMGSGASSASEVLAPYAIGQQQNREVSNLNDQVQTQQAAINTQRLRLQQDYDANVEKVQQERLNSLMDIAAKFRDLSNSYQQQMQTANANRAAALRGEYLQTIDDVNQAIHQTENSYNAKIADINSYYSNYRPATYDIKDVTNSVKNINTAGLEGLTSPQQTAKSINAAYTGIYYDGSNKDKQPLILF